jgi:hypothetical protein
MPLLIGLFFLIGTITLVGNFYFPGVLSNSDAIAGSYTHLPCWFLSVAASARDFAASTAKQSNISPSGF